MNFHHYLLFMKNITFNRECNENENACTLNIYLNKLSCNEPAYKSNQTL